MRFLKPLPLATRPTVTVVIPCYNYGHYLPDAVGSALTQPGVDVDVIIVDDASTDNSQEVADRLASADPRISVITHRQNMRHIATYNDGLSRAAGKYVVLLSADDLLAAGSLARAAALLENRSDVALVYGYAPTFQVAPPAPPRDVASSWSVWKGSDWIGRICRRGNNVVMNPEVVMRTSVLHEIGGYDPNQPQAADMYLWLRAAMIGNVGRVNGTHQGYYRVHDDNMHLTDFSGVLTDLRARHQVFQSLHALLDGGGRARLESVTNRALAREAVRIGCCVSDGIFEQDGPPVDDYRRTALNVWPGIESSRIWRALESRSEGTTPQWRRRIFAIDWDIRNRLRWQRWMRFGV